MKAVEETIYQHMDGEALDYYGKNKAISFPQKAAR